MAYIPNELALVRSTIKQADELVELLDDEASDQSQLLEQIQSILQTQEYGVDLLIELRKKLEFNSEAYKERAKAIRKYADSMDRAKDFVDNSIIALSDELGNRLEGSAEALCIQNNPVKVEYIGGNDTESLSHLAHRCPDLVNTEVVYSINKQFAKDNPEHPVVKQWFTFTQGKHIRVRRSTKPKSLPKD